MRALFAWTFVLLVLHGDSFAEGLGSRERHRRIRSLHGPIHVWSPAGYDPATAATVVFVHGYFVNVDDAWTTYQLAMQFRTSQVNALFIACEAPDSQDDAVSWTSLDAMLRVVADRHGALPGGRLVVIGHSGAHRTLAGWLAEPRLDTIALVDAAYNDLAGYRAWLGERSSRRFIDVGDVTRPMTDMFHRALPETVTVERFPPPERGTLPVEAWDARVVYVRSYMGHMQLVTGGVAIPMILRTLDAPLLDDIDRSSPIIGARAGSAGTGLSHARATRAF